MSSTEHKICKLGAAGTTRDITLTTPETCEILRKFASAKSQCIIMAAHNTGFINIHGIKKHNKKLPVRI
jgi:hypothetical protein